MQCSKMYIDVQRLVGLSVVEYADMAKISVLKTKFWSISNRECIYKLNNFDVAASFKNKQSRNDTGRLGLLIGQG